MSQSITLTITEEERAELESLLDVFIAEIRKDNGEHERTMARVDERIRQTKQLLEQTCAKLGTA